MSIVEKAYAKINLHLEVLNKREDYYHNIFGLFANIDLCDLLKLEDIDISDKNGRSDIRVVSSGGSFSGFIDRLPQSENLAVNAAQLFLSEHGLYGKLRFSLEKNIPPGGGLGGGSSDAAAVLRLLNREVPGLTTGRMEGIAAELGSDVPFCLRGGLAICEMRGEAVETIPGTFPYHVVTANCGIHIDTSWAYGKLERKAEEAGDPSVFNKKKLRIKKAASEGEIGLLKDLLKNDFQAKVFESFSEVKRIYEYFCDMNADYSTMTGSGSTVVGLFRREEEARDAARFLESRVEYVSVSKIFPDILFSTVT